MKRVLHSLLAVVTLCIAAGSVAAQSPYVTYYHPATSYYPSTAYYSTAYYAPGGAVSYRAASPVIAPAPTVSYYGSPVSYYTAPYVTRYRPFLGNTVVRYPYAAQPTVYYAY